MKRAKPHFHLSSDHDAFLAHILVSDGVRLYQQDFGNHEVIETFCQKRRGREIFEERQN